eukprot:TRINITY_DN26701_c0_g1_i1.p1 TRINITY_DN26701_c0_g1~~TRINITY_DN26701_c0_g1_i1.p1  ORF type:complete len:657 (-),score=142.01 TRINITY_DN26701_c0_g1_i1:15-1949(-)
MLATEAVWHADCGLQAFRCNRFVARGHAVRPAQTRGAELWACSAAVAYCGLRHRTGRLHRPPCTCLAAEDGAKLDEAEQAFRQAFLAEAERSELLRAEMQAKLSERLEDGTSTVTVAVEASSSLAPDVPGGKKTWREAFEAAKITTKQLEQQLEKMRGCGVKREVASQAPDSTSPAPDMDDTPTTSKDSVSSASKGSAFDFGVFSILDAEKRSPGEFNKLEDLAQNAIQDDATLRLIAVPILGGKADEEKQGRKLLPAQQVTELFGRDQFVISSTVEFDRVHVMSGQLAATSMDSSMALEALQARLAAEGHGEVELFLQRHQDPGKLLLVAMLKEDLPDNDFPWWQLMLCVFALVATLISVNIETFSVTTLTEQQLKAMSVEQVLTLASKTVPTSACTLATVAAQEAARRAAASKYGVDVTPPFLMPVWPFPSVGCLGAITRRLSIVPNDEASLAMSAAAGFAGYAVSFLLLGYGLSLGPDPDQFVNLNYKILPLVLKVLLRPLLGQSSATEQPDPFVDPVDVAFPANPIIVGGIIGIVVTSLNMLPLNRLDGGILAKGVLGERQGNLLGLLGLVLIVAGSLANNESNVLFLSFGFYALVLQSGSEPPVRDAASQAEGTLRAAALSLLAVGALLCLPGYLLPNA